MRANYSFIVLISLLYSCGTIGPINNRYRSALSKRSQVYLPKPMSTDSQKTANYISAGVSQDPGTDENIIDELTSGYLIYNHSQTFTNFSYSLGGYGFAGLYQNNSTKVGTADTKQQVGSAYFDNKGFYGFGLQSSACVLTVVNNTEFRPIGIELSYSNEFGDYLNYRRTASQQPFIYTDKSSVNLCAGLSTELIFHAANYPENQFGFRLCLGKTFGNHNQNNDSGRLVQDYSAPVVTGSFTFFMQIKPCIMVLEANDGVMFRLGYRF